MRSTEEKVSFRVDWRTVQKILKRVTKQGRKVLITEAFSILSAYGIPTAPYKIVKTKGQALRNAKVLGYPVVLKICSPEIPHKSDVRGVRIGIHDSRELKFHYEDMIAQVAHRAPNAKVEGVVVQQMITEGTELILGTKRDPQFGHLIVFGWGGVYTELLKDFRCAVSPLTLGDAERMISSTTVSKLLEGVRGDPSSDLYFLRECLLRVSQLVSEFPEIIELDINPLRLFSKGGVAIDARIVIA